MTAGYGFRSRHGKFFLLSPFEFHMWWRPVRLWPPCHPQCAGRTEWTDEGFAHYEAHKNDEAPVPLEPGKHYILRSMGAIPDDEYYAYPDAPNLQRFRHEWVLKRRERPVTPAPSAAPMPNFKRSKEESARIWSVYLRPWVLSRTHGQVFRILSQYGQDCSKAAIPGGP